MKATGKSKTEAVLYRFVLGEVDLLNKFYSWLNSKRNNSIGHLPIMAHTLQCSGFYIQTNFFQCSIHKEKLYPANSLTAILNLSLLFFQTLPSHTLYNIIQAWQHMQCTNQNSIKSSSLSLKLHGEILSSISQFDREQLIEATEKLQYTQNHIYRQISKPSNKNVIDH